MLAIFGKRESKVNRLLRVGRIVPTTTYLMYKVYTKANTNLDWNSFPNIYVSCVFLYTCSNDEACSNVPWRD